MPYRETGMFTGIVEELGAVSALEPAAEGGARLVISASLVTEGIRIGDSIAVNGCCLTVVDLGPGWWAADTVGETLARTNLGSLKLGDPVNLERPVPVGGRLGGHLVQGHVDGTGEVVVPAPDLRVAAGDELLQYVVDKGSITVDGVSLTVVSALSDGFTVAVIPHTMAVTTLGRKLPGDAVNLEADVIAKYAERLLRGGAESPYGARPPQPQGATRR
ncbi:MAG TPA: riboflavin synthase [Acidimicrobiales bacterium]|nr:riboflavin synthase [Acidimicrobiales bacterium]